MAFPATATFQSEAGPVDVTVTGHPEQPDAPHMVHLSTQAGVCAHFMLHEFGLFTQHLHDLVQDAQPAAASAPADGPTFATIPAQRDGQADDDDPGRGAELADAPAPAAPAAAVSAVQPFLTAEADA